MMRSMTASMNPRGCSDKFQGLLQGLEFRDRLVGEPDLVGFAAIEHFDDDLDQHVVGGDDVGNSAGVSKVGRGEGIGIADRLDIHHLQSALDQHDFRPPMRRDKADAADRFHFGEAIFAAPQGKTHRPDARADAHGGSLAGDGRRSFAVPAWPFVAIDGSQSRYRIWSVQNRSSRCSDLFRVANSSLEMPPTCSTVLTCFWYSASTMRRISWPCAVRRMRTERRSTRER